jgi:acyl-CoA thioesterase I
LFPLFLLNLNTLRAAIVTVFSWALCSAVYASTLDQLPGSTGLIVYNFGKSGENSTQGLARFASEVINTKPTHVFIYFGINDTLNEARFVVEKTFISNIEDMVKLARGENIIPVICTLHSCDPEALFKRHDSALYGPEGPNKRIDRYNVALLVLAKREQVAVADFDAATRLTGGWRASDGVHLTSSGYRLLADTFLKAAPALEARSRIACIGDSLTFGAGVKGAGTISGETYPAWLLRLSLGGPAK